MRSLSGLLIIAAIVATAMQQVNAKSRGQCSQDEVSAARRTFAYEFYAQIKSQTAASENIMLAPTTLGSALAMVLLGSGGRTKQQMMSSMFRNSKSQNAFDCVVKAYADPFPKPDAEDGRDNSNSSIRLLTASQLYGKTGNIFRSTYIDQTKRYGMDMEEVDFATRTDPVRQYINQRVADATDGIIQDFFKPDDITPETTLAIVSAIYFRGTWEKTFDKDHTRTRDFHVREGETVRADFMIKTTRLRTHLSEKLDAELLELPYRSNERYDASMILIKPATSMERTESNLNEYNLAEELSALFTKYKYLTEVAFPKFKITAEYNLESTLAGMGMTDLTSPGQADLTRMLTPFNSFYVQTAVHKTMLEVDEDGTVGAGATGFNVIPLKLPRHFACDRPFLTIVYEKKNQNIIFIGRVVDPTAS